MIDNLNCADEVHKSRGRNFSRARKRLREIEGMIAGRHGGHVPATDDADYYLEPVANCFRKISADIGHPERLEHLFLFWCSDHAPDIPEEVLRAFASEAAAGPAKLLNDDAVGKQLRLSYEERLRRKITTIGSFDVDRAGRRKRADERRKKRDRARAQAKRKQTGATPREESLSRTEPWKAEGISRSTWERRRKKAGRAHDANSSPHQSSARDANSSPHPSSIVGRRICVSRAPDGSETLPKVTVSDQPDVVELVPIAKAGRARARPLPIHRGLRDQYRDLRAVSR